MEETMPIRNKLHIHSPENMYMSLLALGGGILLAALYRSYSLFHTDIP